MTQSRNARRKTSRKKGLKDEPKPKVRKAEEKLENIHLTQLAKLLEPKLQPRTKLYLEAVLDPYQSSSEAKVPDKIARKSATRVSFVKGAVSTGTVDIGFLAINPQAMVYGDVNAVSLSDAAYASNTINLSSVTTGVRTEMSNSTFLNSDRAFKDYSFRIVGCGIRIQNTNPSLTRGGSIVGMLTPDNQDMLGYDLTDLLAFPQVHAIYPRENVWAHVEYAPRTALQFEFDSTSPADGSAPTTDVKTAPLAIIIQAPASDPQTYQYEAYCIFEMTGMVDGQEDNHVDPLGQAACMELLSELDGSASDKWITQIPALVGKATKYLGKISSNAMPILAAVASLG